jgi:hypothetical protein
MRHTESPEASHYSNGLHLGIYNPVNETLGTTIELEITSQATNFIKQILSFLRYGGKSIVQKPSNSESYAPSSEAFRYLLLQNQGNILLCQVSQVITETMECCA